MEGLKGGAISTTIGYIAYKLFDGSSNMSEEFLVSRKDDTTSDIKVEYIFTYRRHGSNDGAYFLTELKFK